MQKNDLKDFSILMAALEEVFSDRPISRQTVEVYFSLLKDLSIDQMKEGVSRILWQRKYPNLPKPAEIRDAALGAVEDKAILAWNEVMSKTYEDTPKFKDPVIRKVINMAFAGWNNFRISDDYGSRKSFIESYIVYANQEMTKMLKSLDLKLLERK